MPATIDDTDVQVVPRTRVTRVSQRGLPAALMVAALPACERLAAIAERTP